MRWDFQLVYLLLLPTYLKRTGKQIRMVRHLIGTQIPGTLYLQRYANGSHDFNPLKLRYSKRSLKYTA